MPGMRSLVVLAAAGALACGVLTVATLVGAVDPGLFDVLMWLLIFGVIAVGFPTVIVTNRHLKHLFEQPPPRPMTPRGWLVELTGWRSSRELLRVVPRRGAALGLSGFVAGWLVAIAVAVAEFAELPGRPDMSVVFTAGPMAIYSGWALLLAAAMGHRRHQIEHTGA
jgi:uncharacterized protein (TIGR03382 family)